ncbi:fatty acyl-CoA reductase 1-like isoform X1 [Linepithema humile]|uniref:fatty acyl-CoA reductase 1-like isoform X1 n=2 Tax=Linepithema humile TaxID=83485 RepID=UPI00351EEB41
MAINPVKSISEFYAGQSIFLTGATGFVGKVFIEKVLRCCPDVCEIFLLIRPKKDLSVEERLKNILNLPIFDKLRQERPLSFKKLVPILGDTKKEMLGLSVIDRQMLTERVTIIIHAAASVRFNETLTDSILINLRSTRDICILAQSMKNLIALVYIGTAFTHIENAVIEEKIYPPVTDWRKMITVAEHLDEHILNIFTLKYIDNFVNTYIFTKKLAENIIEEYSSSLPCAIIRPSIIVNSVSDPLPGWVDNVYGPIGICIGGGKGLIRVVYHSKHISLDLIPVDFLIKTIIVVPWKLGLTSFAPGSPPSVVNCISQRTVAFYAIANLAIILAEEIPMENVLWTLNSIFTENYIIFYVLTMILHVLPAMLIDLILKFFGRKPMILKIIRNLYVTTCVLRHFMVNQWKFNNTNNIALMSLIPSDEQNTFSFDWCDFDCKEHLKTCLIGAKKFILHEDMNRLDAAKAHYKRVYICVTIFKTIVVSGMLWLMYKYIF